MASRRMLNTTDESAASLDSLAIEGAQAGFLFLEASDLRNVSGAEVLRRSLSTRSVVLTTSSFAQHYQAAVHQPQLQIIRQIGEGLQGTVFEHIGYALVLKKEKPQNSTLGCNLKNEFEIHQQVSTAFAKYENHPEIHCDLTVPRAQAFIAAKDSVPELLSKLPESYRTQTDIVEMERVLPLPKIIRQALIKEFYPFRPESSNEERRQITKETLDAAANKNCLVRPYLGQPRRKVYNPRTFSLRNFILGVEDLRRCEAELITLSQTLGKAYAILHWAAHVNSDDVEFVLGSSIATMPGHSDPSFQCRKIGLYLIDFGQCDKVDMGMPPQDVYQAFRGAMVTGDNACFIPNYRGTPELFRTFKEHYSITAKQILAEGVLEEGKFDIDEFMEAYQEYVEDFL